MQLITAHRLPIATRPVGSGHLPLVELGETTAICYALGAACRRPSTNSTLLPSVQHPLIKTLDALSAVGIVAFVNRLVHLVNS
jgi:hypothetical protein